MAFKLNTTIKERLLSRRVITQSGCWEFTGSRNKYGYGRMFDGKESQGVHRISYALFVGPIGDKFVCHHCDNPPCFNPEHLFIGTHKDNCQDAKRKGRVRCGWVPGMLHGNSKLTDSMVIELRSTYKPFVRTIKMFSKKFGVSFGCVVKALYGQTWAHIPASGKTSGSDK